MLIQFGTLMPFISRTATLPPAHPTSLALRAVTVPSVCVHNGGFRPASSNTQLVSWITARFYGNISDTHEEFDGGGCWGGGGVVFFAADCEQSPQISGGFWINWSRVKALFPIYSLLIISTEEAQDRVACSSVSVAVKLRGGGSRK